MNNARASLFLLVFAAAVFLVSRMVLLPFEQSTSDIELYCLYTQQYKAAGREGVNFYEYHCDRFERFKEEARKSGKLVARIDEYRDVEYPPLTLAVMRFPLLWMSHRNDADLFTPEFENSYRSAYRTGLAVVDVGLLVIVGLMLARLFPEEPPDERYFKLLLYVASTAAIGHLLFDRLDLILAVLVMLSLWLLLGRVHFIWSFVLLAVAVNFKLVPIVLAPVWVVGAMPADRPLRLSCMRTWLGLLVRAAILLGLVAAIFLPFYLADGSRTLGFFTYHRQRPIEINSVWSSVALVLQPFGHPTAIEHSYFSYNIRSSITDRLTALAPYPAAALLLAVTLLLLAAFRRWSFARSREGSTGETLAQVYPRETVTLAVLLLLVFVVTNKVFSPQYLLWLAPLVVLLPFTRKPGRIAMWAFFLACALATAAIPFLFALDMVDPNAPITIPRIFKPPSDRIAVVLVARNLLLVGLTAGLATFLVRRSRSASGGGNHSRFGAPGMVKL